MRTERLILVSNDDGYTAKGIKKLIEVACDYGYVIAVAPSTHQSGKSSSITVDTPLRAHTVERNDRYTLIQVDGTPTDCAKLAINKLLPRRPDLVLSGINHGFNSGNSTIYSGTMGVVFEGCFLNIPSIGFSYGEYSPDADFSQCDTVMRKVIDYVVANGLPKSIGLNVNIPKTEEGVKGIKATVASTGHWTEEFEQRVDPFGRIYYWLTGSFVNDDPDNEDSDLYWLERGYATVTPCHPDQSNIPSVEVLRREFK